MKENPHNNVLTIDIEDNDWHISSSPTSVGYAKKMLSQKLEHEGCTEEEIASFLPEFEKALKSAETVYPEVIITPLVDKEWIGVKLRNKARTWEDNIDQKRTG